MGCTIIGCGKALPALDVPNDDLAQLVETSDEWIRTRTGIESRRIAVQETSADLAETAARSALSWDGPAPGFEGSQPVDPASIDLIVYCTLTPDALVPSTGALLKRRLGLTNAIAFDMNAACSGFIYGLSVAEAMMTASNAAPGAAGRNPVRRALVVGVERLSRVTDWTDRNTCVLFGDGAGAAVVEWDAQKPGILASFLLNEDDDTNALVCPMAYDSLIPFEADGVHPIAEEAAVRVLATADPGLDRTDAELELTERLTTGEPRQAIRMDGQRVFKFAGAAMTHAVEEVLTRARVSIDDVALIVPHQANERIIKYAAKKMGQPLERFQISIAHRGNSSAACVPMTLADAYESGRIHPGDKVVLVAFGGGFTSGAVLFEA